MMKHHNDENGDSMASSPGRNWAGNITYRAERLLRPTSLSELADILASEPRVRALGSRHSFNRIADGPGALVSLADVPVHPTDIRIEDSTVRAPAWLRYGDLVPALDAHHVALANLASLPHISLAGAVATGTHGSGERITSLAAQVRAVEFRNGTGETVVLRRGEEDFDGAVVSLGALGIVTHLTLDVEPTYQVAQRVFEGAHWDAVLAEFDAVTAAGNSVSIFTSWREENLADQIWVKYRQGHPAPDLSGLGAQAAEAQRNPIPGVDGSVCTAQLGEFGPWHGRWPHFRLDFEPSAGDELQSEFLLPRRHAAAAVRALQVLAPAIAPLLYVCEIRTVAPDSLWLSPAYEQETVGFHFTWLPREAEVRPVIAQIEAALAPLGARPHWGKVFHPDAAALPRLYPRWPHFAALRERHDPQRRFGNAFLESLGL